MRLDGILVVGVDLENADGRRAEVASALGNRLEGLSAPASEGEVGSARGKRVGGRRSDRSACVVDDGGQRGVGFGYDCPAFVRIGGDG